MPDWGAHSGTLKVEHDTPYPLGDVALTMTVSAPPPALTIAKTPAHDPVGIGLPFYYTITVDNAAGPATGVTISDTLPANALFESASHGGALVGKDVVWSGLSISGVDSISVFFTVTVEAVSPGTPIVNAAYQVTATEWLTPALGRPVTVTAAAPGVGISVQPVSLTATLSPGETTSATMTIGNVGTAGLSWALAETPDVSWLSVAEMGGSVGPLGSTDVVVTFTAPLPATSPVYTTTLLINSNDPDQRTVTVPVTLAVTGACERIAGVDFVYRPAVPLVGDGVVFTGTAAAGTVHQPVTYTWDLGDGSAARVGRTIIHAFAPTVTVRSYTVTLGVANACPSWGVAEKSITVRPHTVYLPIATRTGGSVSSPTNGPIQEKRPKLSSREHVAQQTNGVDALFQSRRPQGQRSGEPGLSAPIPALVRVDLRSPSDLERVAAGLAGESRPTPDEGASGSSTLVYAHLFDSAGQELLLLPADPLQQGVLLLQGLSLRVLDPDSRDAAYYMLHVRRPGALRQARALVSVLDEDGSCSSAHPVLPSWAAGGGAKGCQVLVRATTPQAEQLVEFGIDLQPLVLHPLVQRLEEQGYLMASDIMYDSLVQEMVGQVQTDTVISYDGGLSGEWPVIVGGAPYTIVTRHSYSGQPILRATQYAYERFQQAGLDVAFHNYIWSGNHWRNVVAEQPGSTEPDQIVLITAHIDDMPSGPVAPGADDNASGTTAVLVAADILSQYHFRHTLRYVLFTGEEQGLRGSAAYAEQVYAAGDNIAGVLNLDMIAYNSDASPIVDLHARSALPASVQIAETFSQVVALYNLDLVPDILINDWLGNYSDNKSFWDEGYPAILAIEDEDDFTPYYHTTGDLLATLDDAYFTHFVRAAVGTIAHMAGPPDGHLVGRVYDGQTGTSIAGAAVEVGFSAMPIWSTTSGVDGTYHLALPAGTYRVTVTAPWYVPTVTTPITVASSQTVTLDIPLQLAPCDAVTDAALSYLPLAPWVGDTVVFSGSVASGTLPIAYAWAFGDGASGNGSVVPHVYQASGVYTVVMTAVNCRGRFDSVATSYITVTDRPVIGVSPSALTAALRAGGTTSRALAISNGGKADLVWSLVEESAVDWLGATPLSGTVPALDSAAVVVTFTAPSSMTEAIYTTALRISSNDPDWPEVVVPVTLTVGAKCEPVTGADFTYVPMMPRTGEMVTFTGIVSAGTASLPITTTWDLGDGSPSLTVRINGVLGGGAVVTHTFPLTMAVRAYTVTMEVANVCSDPRLVKKGVTVQPYRVYLPAIVREEP
jgi:uncharacterized repeat protein (TIGR01451 family)